jgi:hypothetical protein
LKLFLAKQTYNIGAKPHGDSPFFYWNFNRSVVIN